MGSILNGIALQSLTRPYGGTFLVFSDYMRPAVRLAALMQLPATFVWTHDSIGLGEDGPTHQPVEHLAALRAIPGLDVVRPGGRQRDRRLLARVLEHARPSRRSRPDPPKAAGPRPGRRWFRRREGAASGRLRAGEAATVPARVILIATGSEVHVALRRRRTTGG